MKNIIYEKKQACYIGCYADSSTTRDMNGLITKNTGVLTIEMCINTCRLNSFEYAGVQNG